MPHSHVRLQFGVRLDHLEELKALHRTDFAMVIEIILVYSDLLSCCIALLLSYSLALLLYCYRALVLS